MNKVHINKNEIEHLSIHFKDGEAISCSIDECINLIKKESLKSLIALMVVNLTSKQMPVIFKPLINAGCLEEFVSLD